MLQLKEAIQVPSPLLGPPRKELATLSVQKATSGWPFCLCSSLYVGSPSLSLRTLIPSLTYDLCLQVYEEHLTHPEVVGEPQAGVDGSVAIISLPLQYPLGEPLECGERGVCLYDGRRLRPLEDDALLLLFG